MKDIYTVIHNPDNYFFKHELWVKGERKTWDGRDMITEVVTKKISSYRTHTTAMSKKEYWEDLQEFKLNG